MRMCDSFQENFLEIVEAPIKVGPDIPAVGLLKAELVEILSAS